MRRPDLLRLRDLIDASASPTEDFDQFIGPEDPRLFFTDDGQPLLIYSQNGRIPNVCRALYIIDARMVIPGLDQALQRAGWNAPIQFREQTGQLCAQFPVLPKAVRSLKVSPMQISFAKTSSSEHWIRETPDSSPC